MNEGRPYPPEGNTWLPASLSRLGRLTRKELRETLRDRRTIVTLVLMPLLLYPMLGLVLRQITSGKLLTDTAPHYRVGMDARAFPTRKEMNEALAWLWGGARRLMAEGAYAVFEEASLPGTPPPAASALPLPDLTVFRMDDLDAQVLRGHIDVGIRASSANLAAGGELLYLEDSATSCEAVRFLQRLFEAARAGELESRQKTQPVTLQPVPVPQIAHARPSPFLVLMPLILILMTITGAVYPAIDLTAGERERGTMEILMAAPVPRLSLLLAKYVAVVTVAMLTALINLGSMALTLWISGLGRRLIGIEGLSPLLSVEVFLLLLLFAAFFAALLLVLTSFARSFKEAQAYLIPLMLVALVPGVMSLVPGLHLDGPLVLVPLLNIVLLARDLLLGEATVFATVFVIASTVMYALVAIVVAALLFGADAVRAGPGGWFGRRRNMELT
jgi:ABC-2 type transport system permease protein/sodium transport system permease protein